jgi:hypothetical protein
MKKDIIYIDADDEIAAVVDKVVASKSKVVALVLPKRFTMLHSSVNMKILNKAAQSNKKNLVLITSEKALMPIAAAIGMYVAKGLQSKPAVPPALAAEPETDDAVVPDEEPQLDPNAPIGELAGDTDDTITLDNSMPESDAIEEAAKKDTPKKDKKLAVPNFEKFRVKLFLSIAGVLALVIFVVLALFVWPRATITLAVEQQQIPLSVDITANPTKTDDVAAKSFKLETKTIDKAETRTADATGKKDLGEKATGAVQLSVPCAAVTTYPLTIPSGTGVSTGGLTFITQESVSLTSPGGSGGSGCKFSNSVDVTAQNAGGEYNVNSGRTFSVAGFSNVSGTNKEGFSGGSSKVITVVSQEDCDRLQNEMNAASTSEEMKKQLTSEFTNSGVTPSLDTYKVETVSSTCEPGVGQEAAKVTAKATYRFTMSGVSTSSLNQLLEQEALAKAGQGQTVADTGVSSATITVDSRSGSTLNLTVKTTATTGVKQDETAIKSLVAGKNARQTSDSLKQIPGVKEVKVDYSPFWVNKTPKNQDHITLVFSTNETN